MFDDWWYLYLFWKEELTYYILIFSFFTYELWYSTGWLFRAWLHYLVLLIVRRFRFTCYISNDLLAWRCLVLLSIAQCCSAWLNAAQHCSVLLGNARHYTVLLSAVRCCTPLHAVACCCIPLHAAIPWHWLALLGMKKMF